MAIMFDEAIAIEYGVDAAIFIQNLYFWIRKNEANEKHFHDGRTWTYNTFQAWCALFPFWSEKQVRRIVKNLESDGVILTANYNKIAFDRTLWYALSDEVLCMCRNGHMHLPKRANEKCPNGQMRSAQTGAPIPDSKPDDLPNNTPQPPKGKEDEPKENPLMLRFDRFWSAYPKRQAKGTARKAWERLKPDDALLDRMLAAIAWQQRSEQWRKDGGQFIPLPATWLNAQRWEDDKSKYTMPESQYNFLN